MKIRRMLAAGVVAALTFAGVSQAQDTCFGLSEADCALIASATQNTLASATSFNQTWSIDFNVTGVPDSEAVTFSITGSGPVVIDLMNQEMPISFNQRMELSAPSMATINAILKDGTLYFETGDGAYQSINLMEALEQQAQSGALPVNPQDLLSGGGMGDMDQAMGALSALGDITTIPGFLNYSRAGADFTFVADLTVLLNNPSFQTAINSLSEAAGPDGAQLAMLGSLLPMLLSEGKITVVQTVDEGANLVTGIDFIVNGTINAAMLDSSATDPIVLTLNFSVDLSGVNEMYDIVAPANATPVDMGQ